jgi:hypothetical protein
MGTSKTRYTLAEAVRACGISQSYVRLLIRQGRLKTEPKDAGLVFDESALTALKSTPVRVAELEKENTDLRARLAQANAYVDSYRQRAEMAENGLQIMRETLATMNGIELPPPAPRDDTPPGAVHQLEQDYRDLTGGQHHVGGGTGQ